MGGKIDESARRQSSRGRPNDDLDIARSRQSSQMFQPWLKKCAGWGKVCCLKPHKAKVKGKPLRGAATTETTLCPGEFSGLRPVPYDCTKFANCWKGAAVIQSCGPGTHFNARTLVCDWPAKANCSLTSINVQTSFSSTISIGATSEEIEEDDSDETEYDDLDYELWDLTLNGYARAGFGPRKKITFPGKRKLDHLV